MRQRWKCYEQRSRIREHEFHQRHHRDWVTAKSCEQGHPLAGCGNGVTCPESGAPSSSELGVSAFSLPVHRPSDVSSQGSRQAGILNSGCPIQLKRPCTSGSPCRERMRLPAFSLKCLFVRYPDSRYRKPPPSCQPAPLI